MSAMFELTDYGVPRSPQWHEFTGDYQDLPENLHAHAKAVALDRFWDSNGELNRSNNTTVRLCVSGTDERGHEVEQDEDFCIYDNDIMADALTEWLEANPLMIDVFARASAVAAVVRKSKTA